MPTILILLLIPIYLNYYNARNISIPWMIFITLFIITGTLASWHSYEELRGVAFIVMMVMPMSYIALRYDKLDKLIVPYVVISLILVNIWIIWHFFYLRELKPWAIESTSGSGNLFAAMLNLLWPVMLKIYYDEKGVKKQISLILVIISMVSVIVLFSRSGLLILAVLITILLIKKVKFKIFYLIATISILSTIYFDQLLIFFTKYRFISYHAALPRVLIWNEAWISIKKNILLGVGPGLASNALRFINIYHAHNNIIHVTLECGIIGAILICAFQLAIVFVAWKCWKSHSDSFFISASLVGYLIYSLVETPITHPELTMMLAIFLNYARYVLSSDTYENAAK